MGRTITTRLDGKGRRLGLAVALALLALLAAAGPAAASSSLDAQLIDAFLAAHGSPMTGSGATFMAESAEHGVDPALLVAIAGAESSFGQFLYDNQGDQATYNAFNWFYTASRSDADFGTWQDAITAVAAGISGHLYYGSGLYSVDQIGPRYCPEGTENWLTNVKLFMTALGGDPADTRLVAAAPPAFDPSLLTLQGAVTVENAAGGHGVQTVGNEVTARFSITNNGDTPVSLDAVTLAIRDPRGVAHDLAAGTLLLEAHSTRSFVGTWDLTERGRWTGWIEVQHGGERSLLGASTALDLVAGLPKDLELRRWVLNELELTATP
jgi:hypothetical protein